MTVFVFITVSTAACLIAWLLVNRARKREVAPDPEAPAREIGPDLEIRPPELELVRDAELEPALDFYNSGTVTVQVSPRALYPTVDILEPAPRELLRAGIACIPKLPGVCFKALPMLSKPGCGANEIAEIIQNDQTVAARLLRLSNSSYYGFEKKVDSIQMAVALLGNDTVRSLVLEDSFSRLGVLKDIEGLKVETIWNHAAAVSAIARHLAKNMRNLESNVAATAGLLHDVGILIMMIMGRTRMVEALRRCDDKQKLLIEHEFDVFGANHQIYGDLFIEAWNIPNAIRTAIGRHHCPLEEPFNQLAAVIWLSDYIASRAGFACPAHQVPIADETDLNFLLVQCGLKPPLERYETESLARELAHCTKFLAATAELAT